MVHSSQFIGRSKDKKKKGKLKKQSQFAGGQIGVNSYLKGDYGKITASEVRENKANLMVNGSQFIVHRKEKEREFEKTKPNLWFIVRSSQFVAKAWKGYMKKQSQFVNRQNEHKCLFERLL